MVSGWSQGQLANTTNASTTDAVVFILSVSRTRPSFPIGFPTGFPSSRLPTGTGPLLLMMRFSLIKVA